MEANMNMIDFLMGALLGTFITLCVYEWNIFDDFQKYLMAKEEEK